MFDQHYFLITTVLLSLINSFSYVKWFEPKRTKLLGSCMCSGKELTDDSLTGAKHKHKPLL